MNRSVRRNARALSLGIVLVVWSRMAAAAAPCDGVPRALVVVGGTLIDGSGAPPRPDTTVVALGARIVAVGELAPSALPACRDEIDAAGATVLPGLVDAHVHLERLLAREPGALAAWLAAGVTSLVDLGSPSLPDALASRLRAAASPAPRLYASGPILTAPGGYPFLRQGGPALEVASAGEAAAAVDRLADGGAAVVKVAVEAGFLADLGAGDWPVPAPAVLHAIAERAHARGLRVLAHLTQPGELAAALAAGFDGVAHSPIAPLPAEQIALAARRGVVFTTTAALWSDAPHRAAACTNLRRLLDAGGRVALGTDAPAFAEPGLPRREIAALSACALTPMEILVAATGGAAQALGRAGELGVVAPGARADLLVVEGDPLADLAALERVRAVVVDGVRLPRPPDEPR